MDSSSVLCPWKVSLHGGHSGEFCDHAEGRLEELIEAACNLGYHTYGVAEHAPRLEPERLYDEERQLGWDTATLERLFAQYAETLDRLSARYAGRITVLRGFEAEVVPEDRYAEIMLGYRRRYPFDYMVGSVHWVAGSIIDYKPEHFARAVETCGGLEALAVRYYETVADMVLRLRPEVVAHLDLIRRGAANEESVSTPRIRRAALTTLEVIRDHEAILDINTSGYRKGPGRPYPAPWLLTAARDMGIPCCFGDDSHRPAEVGAGIPEARDYLLKHGILTITVLTRDSAGIGRRITSLT